MDSPVLCRHGTNSHVGTPFSLFTLDHILAIDCFSNSFVWTTLSKLVELAATRGRTMPAFAKNALGIIAYPRTGKRGVPQQFPRRVYEMLQSESKLLEGSSDHEGIIAWSDSGKAFCIVDVPMFSSDVLPRYFNTSKFSSFQRNLNLVSICHLPVSRSDNVM